MKTRGSGRARMGALTLLVAIFAAGCGGTSKTNESAKAPEPIATATTTTSAPTVDQAREAGTVARAIENEPNRAAEILAQHGMTAEGLQSLILEIAKDPQLTDAYEQAKTGASSK